MAPSAFALAAAVLAARPAAAAVPLYPDLFCWSERGRYGLFDAEIVLSGGRKNLRFTTAIANRGQGPFQLQGSVAPDGTTTASQRVFYDDGSFVDRPAGTFVFSGHAGHDHFHYAEFAEYRLRAVGPGGSVGAELGRSEKVGFAMWDVAAYDRTLPGAPQTAFYTRPASVDPADQTQGISVGWADVYERTLSDQDIDVTGLPDGTYWLEVSVDPNNRLAESDEANNKTWVKLAIAGNTVTTFDDQPPAPATFVSLTFDDIRASQRVARDLLDARGLKATFFANSGRVGAPGSLSLADLQALAAAGHEIAGHTIDHLDLTTLTPEERQRQVCDDRAALVGWGFDPVSFAYPFGAHDAASEAVVQACGYRGARTTGGVGCPSCPAGESLPPGDAYALIAPASIRETTTLAELQQYVTAAEAANAWLILTFHDVGVPGTFNISSATLAAFLDWLRAREAAGTAVRTVRQVIDALPAPPPPPPAESLFFDGFATPDGLVTNENPSSPRSTKWLVTEGSLFASGGQGWTGVPDGASPDAASSNGTGSALFRALTQASDFATEVNLKLTVQGFVSVLPANAWDGAHVFLRYQDASNFYYVSIHRRDGRAAIKKRRGGTTSTFTTPLYSPPLGVRQSARVTAVNNPDGSVTIELHVNGVLIARAVDSSFPFTAPGKVGMAGENTEFRFDDFAVGSSSVPPPAETFTQSVVVSGLQSPTAMAFAPDGRLFVCEQAGRLRVVKDGALLVAPFLTLPVDSSGEKGLLGVAFDPAFALNRYLYVYYTTAAGRNRLSRFRASASAPDVVEAGSETFLIGDIGLPAANHNGGVIHFGTDGKLYVGVGDHGTSANAQDLGVLGGKLLRLDPAAYPDIIPPDNPFVGQAGARGEVWAYGLRNPFTFNVDPASGTIHVNDVGEATYEEIDRGARGANYGWPTCEGPCAPPRAGLTDPLYFYAQGPGCAITGGAFYRGGRFPASFEGAYFFSDYCGNFVKVLRPDGSVADFASGFGAPVDLQTGPDGALYVLEHASGEVTRISHSAPGANRPPSVGASASPPGGPAPLAVSFSAAAADPDGDLLGYAWDFGDGTYGFGPAPSHVYGSTGSFLARVLVTDGRGGSASVQVLVVSGSSLPGAALTAPPEGTYYSAGATVPFAGLGTDPEDGALPPSAYSWRVVFHHEDHTHPFLGPLEGVTSGAFTVPVVGETSTDTWHRIHLTVRDSDGLTREVTRDVRPATTTLTVASVPPGLSLTVDGIPRAAPSAVGAVAGMRRTLGAPSPQALGGRTYEFVSWSDGGAAAHDVAAPASDASYTATYREVAAAAFSDSFDYPDGLITNENPSSPRSAKWLVIEGSLFASGGQGWTGVPDTVTPNAASSNGTGSALFRALTQPSDFATELTLKLTVAGFPLAGQVWDGAHVYLRWQDSSNYYYVSVHRRDGRAAIKKRRFGTVSTFTTPFYGPPLGVQQAVRVTAVNNPDGSVTIELYVNGVLRARAVDSSSPITAPGRVGMAGENADFRFDDFVVDPSSAPPAPPPVLEAVEPGGAAAGTSGFVLRALGRDFSPSSVVRWNGSDRPTSFVSTAALTAQIAAADIASTGTAAVTVFTPAPGGGVSAALPVSVSTVLPAEVTPSPGPTDRFGVARLYPTAPGGKEWTARWDDGTPRSFGPTVDPADPWFDAGHDGAAYDVDGAGIMAVSGASPRMYVRDPGRSVYNSWRDVEITVYGYRVSDSSIPYAGLEAVARTNHGVTGPEDTDLCDSRGVGGRMRHDGGVDFEKETRHPSSIQVSSRTLWPGGMPHGRWIGYKLVVYDVPGGRVRLELWHDDSDGAGGGDWRKVDALEDTGANVGVGEPACAAGVDPALPLTDADARPGSESGKPNIAVYFRDDGVGTRGLLLKRMSVREIDPAAAISASSGVPPATSTGPFALFGASVLASSTVAIVTWETNAGADSQVLYGTSAALGQATPLVGGLRTSHTVTLPGLESGLTYHWRAVSRNEFGDVSQSAVRTFDTEGTPPAITGLRPDSRVAGGPGFVLHVDGLGFVSSSTLRWNGADRTTRVLHGTGLEADILASDIAAQGSAAVTVRNPGPGGGTSSSATFTVLPPRSPQWSLTGSPGTGRPDHAATLLADGRVLLAGGDGENLLPSELYERASGSWTPAGLGIREWAGRAAARLADGRVLVTGGYGFECCGDGAELFDPFAGASSATAAMSRGRQGHSLILLPDGRALAAGGRDSSDEAISLADAELYDPAAGTWALAAPLATARRDHTATLLRDGRVLVAGGLVRRRVAAEVTQEVTASAELYDPATGAWSPTAPMSARRTLHAAALLPDGKVLAAGGSSDDDSALASAEVYDPAAGTWSPAPAMAAARMFHTATALQDGRVLVAGGTGRAGRSPYNSAELYDPASGAWTAGGFMSQPRARHTATLLAGGEVLVVDSAGTADLFDPGPALAAIVPSSVSAGSPGLTLSLFGQRFSTASVVEWGGAPRLTTFVSVSTLTAAIPASDLAAPATVQVTVSGPAGRSAPLPFVIHPASAPAAAFADAFPYPDGLITNENPSSPRSPKWLVTEGSLFASGGQGWTGVPDTVAPNATSSNGTGSALFRALTQPSGFATEVTFALTVAGFPLGTAVYNGAHVYLRYQDPGNFYQVSVRRRDGRTAIKKKRAGAWTTFTTPLNAPPLGARSSIRVRAVNQADGSVLIELFSGTTLLARVVDSSSPLTAPGKVGLAGENVEFRFDDVVIDGPAGGGAGPAALSGSAPAAGPDGAFALRDLYVFPNPSRGAQRPTFRVQVGLADAVSLNIYDVSGRLVHSAGFGPPAVLDDGNGKGPQYTFEYPWDAGGAGSGVYIGVVTARKAGQPALRDVTRLAVIK